MAQLKSLVSSSGSPFNLTKQVTTLTTKQYNSIEYRYFYNREGIFYGLNGRI